MRDQQDKVKLGWEIQLHSLDENNFWIIDIDANDGSLINKFDHVIHCSFGFEKYLESHENTKEHHYRIIDDATAMPYGANNSTEEITANASYRVYPFTIESPIYGSRQLLTDPADIIASPYGWHDTNGDINPDYTITRGNNVYAYTDKDGNNSPDANSSPDGGAALNFDYNIDFSTHLNVSENSKAVVTQLFYMNNIMHDIFYKMGFTESNRNFQAKNYTGVPGGNDFVWAEAQDGSKDKYGNVLKGNANFVTYPDGVNTNSNRSRMQMFMWSSTPPPTVTYNSPAGIAGDIYNGSQSDWGPCSYNITGAVANALSNSTPPEYVCDAVTNASSIAGKIALIDRGDCQFSEKIYNAQLAGAIGVIIINRQSAEDSLSNMASGNFANLVTIPAVFVTYADGEKLRNNINTATVTMFRQSTNDCIDYDGSLDNGIVAHEYGHGISNRLTGINTGAGGTSSCLTNAEQGGEGWSDFFALALTKKASDNKNTARGVGNYVDGKTPSGGGIRNYPYSYDMSINPLTYAALGTTVDEVHDIGEVWAVTLWDMYWNLVDKYGYSNDLYNGTGGNNRAIKLVIEGLKQQPCSPGFIDARNAILKADSILYGYADKCEIWAAFARRGMGVNAKQGSSNRINDQTVNFSLPATCNNSPTATASFTSSDSTVCIGSSLIFTNTSTASAGNPDSVRWIIPGGTPSTATSMTTINPIFNTAGNFTISLIAYKSGNASVAHEKIIRVKNKPTVTVNSPSSCAGAQVTLTANGATSYSWNTGASSISINVNPSTTTNYTVTGTKDGCSNTATSIVTVTNTTPSLTILSNPSGGNVCEGENITLTADGADNYTWTSAQTGTTTGKTLVFIPNGNMTVNLSGTANGCTTQGVAFINIILKNKPSIMVNSPNSCSGDLVTLTATGATTYTWSNATSGASINVSPAFTTTYTVTGTKDGCSNTATSTVTVQEKPALPVITQTGDTLHSSTIIVGATYEWYKNGMLVSSSTNPNFKITESGSYTVKVKNGNCSSESVAFAAVYTSIKNATNSIQLLEIYPNPTDGRLQLNMNLTKNVNVQIYLYSPDGRELYNQSIANTRNVSEEINLHDFAKGMYILRLKVEDEIYYHKVVKQ